MLFAEDVELFQDNQHSSKHHKEIDDVYDRFYESHGDLRTLNFTVADLLSFLRLGRWSVFCDQAYH